MNTQENISGAENLAQDGTTGTTGATEDSTAEDALTEGAATEGTACKSAAASDGGSGAQGGASKSPAASNSAASSSAAASQRPAFKVILASASPRRKKLLADAGVQFTSHASQVDESLEPDLLANPPEACKKLAERKAGAVVQELLANVSAAGMFIILGADTMVVHQGEIFGKPRNLSDAKRMLRCLSGDTHQVITAVSVWMIRVDEDNQVSLGFRTFTDEAQVIFHELSDEAIAEYLRKGESFDKAGAYAAQGEGAKLIERIDGSLDTVIGLPVGRLLREFPDLAPTN